MTQHGRQRRGSVTRGPAAGSGQRGAARKRSLAEIRRELAGSLRERLPELEAAIETRVYAIADPREVADPPYVEGIHAAIGASLEYALDALEVGERRAPGMSPLLLEQARLAARVGVSLDTVLRRYFAGNALFGDLLVEEAERARVPGVDLRRLLGEQGMLFDRLLATVSAEHTREARNRPTSTHDRRRECVRRLLAGELVDHSELEYELDAHHLGLIIKGEGAQELGRELAGRLDRRLLAVRREEEPKWACWLGGRRALAPEAALEVLAELAPEGVLVAVGEPGEGLGGWRFTHRQAKAAMPIAERKGRRVLRYTDVAVLAAILGDDLIAGSLRQLYLTPLERARDGGQVARETLRAYFAAERNVSSTAAALGVDRRTVRNRIGAVEALLGRPLEAVASDLEIALRLDD